VLSIQDKFPEKSVSARLTLRNGGVYVDFERERDKKSS